MFNPIENGTIFEMALAVVIGFICGATIELCCFHAMQELGYDLTEKGAWSKFVKHIFRSIKEAAFK